LDSPIPKREQLTTSLLYNPEGTSLLAAVFGSEVVDLFLFSEGKHGTVYKEAEVACLSNLVTIPASN
jgi:hypothetical protein